MKLANRLLSVLVALALLILGLLVLLEIVWTWGFGGSQEVLLPYPAVAGYLADQTWAGRPTRSILFALVLVGALLLAVQLRRRQPALVLLGGAEPSVTRGADRRSLERAAARAAGDVEGIRSARARVSRRRITVAAVAGVRDTAGLQDRVEERMASWLDGLNLDDPPTVSVDVNAGRSS